MLFRSQVAPPAAPDQWSSLLQQFPGVVQPFTVSSQPTHGVQHHLVTSGPPVTAKFRRLDPTRLAAAKAEFDDMLKAGVVRRSSSCWSSPLHMVRKKDGGWRPCGDFRRLNRITAEDKYPLPNMADLAARLDGCTIFSKLDLQKGYLQVPVAPEDIPKTAVITPFGLFEFIRMPFGLKNAGMTFQRLMDNIFFDLPFAIVYLDDMLIASRTPEQHRLHLQQVLLLLQQNGLVLNVGKCELGRPSVEFLGHQVSAAGLAPLPQRVAAVQDFPPPTNVKELQAFLGMFNFYRRFVPAAAKLLQPLTDALRGGPKGPTPISWSAPMQSAFSAAKAAIADTALLDHPAHDAELSMATDASGSHLGSVLQQRRPGGHWRPLAFFSRKLSPTEAGYSAFDRELLAVYSSILHFRHMLEGRPFTVFTDHRPLLGALERVSEPRSDRQRRQLSFIAEFAVNMQHIAGSTNIVADTLSRPPPQTLAADTAVAAVRWELPGLSGAQCTVSSNAAAGAAVQREFPGIAGAPAPPVIAQSEAANQAPTPPVDLQELAAAQPSCPDCQRALSSPALRVITADIGGAQLLVDTSSGVFRPLVPAAFRRRIFTAVHSIAHPGVRATRRLISSRYIWPGLARDVRSWCRDCQDCQRSKVTRQPTAAVQPIPVPIQRFSHIHVDLVGPLPASPSGYTHILTAVDRSTRWAEAFPLRATAAADCADALLQGWVARFGVPASLTSDRGVQFSSSTWAALMQVFFQVGWFYVYL